MDSYFISFFFWLNITWIHFNQKLAIGGTVEKVVSAFHSVISEHPNEDMDLNKCKAAVRRVGKMEKDVDIACAQGKSIL